MLITYFLLVKESSRFVNTRYEQLGIGQTADKIYGHVLDTLNIQLSHKQKVLLT
jgi:hypothetical protein